MNVIHPEAPKADLRPAATPAGTAPAPVIEPTAKRPFWPWLLGLAALGGVGFYALEMRQEATAPAATTAAALPAGEFRLNETEMRALRIEPVATMRRMASALGL